MKFHRLSSLLLLLIFVAGCTPDRPIDPPGKAGRTVIVYINADNNLFDRYNTSDYYGALVDINEMEKAWDDNSKDVLLVYFNSGEHSKLGEYEKSTPKVLRIKHDDDLHQINSPVLKTYGKQDASDTLVLARVLKDAVALAPADNYGLIMWSHGTGWVPREAGPPLRSSDGPTSYTFGVSESYAYSQMEIDGLARALPGDVKFDFIAFDVCYMGGVEVAYQLRNSCKYFIASAGETPIDGFEYDLLLKDIMSANVTDWVRKAYEYNKGMTGWRRTCALSVIDCSQLESLAGALHNLIVSSPRSLSDVNYYQIQDHGSSAEFREVYYDLSDFVNKTWAGAAGLDAFNKAMKDVAVSKYFLPYSMGVYKIDTYCGLTCFIPRPHQKKAIKIFRECYDWSKASGMGLMN